MRCHLLKSAPVWLIVSLTIAVPACFYTADGGEKEISPQTHILDVLVEPDTVAPQDTATFTCIIEDSTDKRFKFYWVIDSGVALSGEVTDPEYPSRFRTDNNKMRWKRPQKLGFYSFEVTANNGSKDSLGVRSSFSIVVK